MGKNLQKELEFPNKADMRMQPDLAELNNILQDRVMDGALTTFGMGVRLVPRRDSCQMLFIWHAKEVLSQLQPADLHPSLQTT